MSSGIGGPVREARCPEPPLFRTPSAAPAGDRCPVGGACSATCLLRADRAGDWRCQLTLRWHFGGVSSDPRSSSH
ncbi:hypothetical protein OJAV_G00084340 [Oryzias javanicus]|uniref:Uncharacterized protein n=1 Tax=Oryzias javanicus TaxID=123683 RepID=A0A3S2PUL3_ORYJA|nr:hypothetical protein OJAV_G00084340 [Oryzias javanicus]